MDVEFSNKSLDQFIQIPKVELHAHLNGSLSLTTLEKLKTLKKEKCPNAVDVDFTSMDFSSNNLTQCFRLFPLIHSLTDNPEALYMATCDVIKDFYDDGVCYLELRTTPRDGSNMNQNNFVETVLKAINITVAELNEKISVKLILSIDRKRPYCSAEETVKNAIKYYIASQSIVGIDLSGDPTVGNIKDFIPLLEHAKKAGLKLAIHIAEVPNTNEEVKELLKLWPHRLGHGTFLHPSKGGSHTNFNTLKELRIPLETCLTSNVISKTVQSYEKHHFQLFREINYPCVLCTDDKGVFNTSLSKEYLLASKYYALTTDMLFDLSYNSIDFTFSSKSEKEELKKIWNLKR